MKNDIFGISVGAYCIRLLRMSPKGTYDQKSMYMWGVCNIPLPWRTKRSIPKINFGVMRNSITFFLIWKMFMQNWLYLYWNRENVMWNCMTIFLIWKMVMKNRLSIYLNRKNVMRNGMTIFLIWKMVMQNRLYLYLNRKRSMRNGILGISVGAYCIRPLKMPPKGTYDQKSMYMWGVFNTPLPWRTKRSIPKINFGVMQNGMILFLIWKRVMRNGIGIFLNWEIVMQNVLTFYLNRKRVMQNGILDISVGAYCIRPIKTAQKGTYDQKSRYMWGVFNTPLPWRKKGSISKINLRLCKMVWPLFWSKKWSWETDYTSIWIEKWLYKIAWPSFWIEKWSCKMAGKDFGNMF